jgi:alginate O-acetyltransferase complex protein AlgI
VSTSTPAVAPKAQRTVPLPRLALAWSVMLGGLVGFWCTRPFLGPIVWTFGEAGVLFASSKFASLVCMPPDDRRRLNWDRLVAYLLWPGMQPRHFLPERTPADSETAPTVLGMSLNLAASAVFIWLIPVLMPDGWPMTLRLASAAIGFVWLYLFAFFDAVALVFRALGYGVEKLWDNPIASTSLMEFWGRRWNRIFSGMLRETLFLPLSRRVGAGLALFAVFFYSGLLHENLSFAAMSGFGLPLLYFLIQGAATFLETLRPFRRSLQRRPWLGWLWTAAVVVTPVPLLFHEGFRDRILAPTFVDLRVPGMKLP